MLNFILGSVVSAAGRSSAKIAEANIAPYALDNSTFFERTMGGKSVAPAQAIATE